MPPEFPLESQLAADGLARQEEAKLLDFLASRFGRYYAKGL